MLKVISYFISKPFEVRSVVRSNVWSATVFISFDDIEKIFKVKRDKLVKGYCFFGNFYKCGDETKHPHFGMWNEILVDDDFHQRQYFGKLIIGE